MPILQTTEPVFGDSFPTVLATAEGLRAPRHVDIATALYPVQKIFPPGLFVGTHTGGKARLLPRVTLAVAANSGQANITVPAFMAGLFVAGDVLNVITLPGGTAGAAVGTVQSVNTSTNVITLTANLAATLNIGTVIGVAASVPIGMICPNTAIDVGMTKRANSHYGVFTQATLVRSRLRQWDSQLAALPGCLYTLREVP